MDIKVIESASKYIELLERFFSGSITAHDFSTEFIRICDNDRVIFDRNEAVYDADVEDILMNIFSAVEAYSPSWQKGDPLYRISEAHMKKEVTENYERLKALLSKQ